MITRRELLRGLRLAPAALLAWPKQVRVARAAKKKRKKKVLKAILPAMTGAPSGSFVVPNTRATTTNVTLEYYDGSYHTIAAGEYRIAAFSGYVVKRSLDDAGATVDWSAILPYPMYWSGTIVSANGPTPITRELLQFQEVTRTNPIDAEGAIDLELAYNAVLDLLFVGGGQVRIDDDGISILAPTTAADLNAYKFRDNLGTTIAALYGSGITDNNLSLTTASQAKNSAVGVTAVSLAGYLARAGIGANAGAPTTAASITLYADDSQSPPYNAILMQIASSDAFNVTTLSDGVGAKIYGKLLQIATSKTPASAASTGNAGEICWDSNYVYVCVASNTWKRVALSTW